MINNSEIKRVFTANGKLTFASYLAGLIEGDGHVTTRQIIILFNGSHFDGAQKLQNLLGGSLTKIKTAYAWRYVISRMDTLSYVLKATSKQWVGPFKTYQIEKHGLIQRYGLRLQHQTLTLTNAWIAGFTDADGCFDISIRKCPTTALKTRVDLRITYSQKDAFLITQIKHCFGVKGVYKEKNKAATA